MATGRWFWRVDPGRAGQADSDWDKLADATSQWAQQAVSHALLPLASGSMGFIVEPLSQVMDAAREVLREGFSGERLRDRLLGFAAGSVLGDDTLLQLALNTYREEYGLSFVSTVETDDDTLMVFFKPD